MTERPPTVDPAEAGSRLFDSRFTPGTLLAGRYRIVGRLGKGGMGEVYRADDLKLGQAVALKFLPEGFARDPRWLRRFNDEVRIARDVAHPNVCRTYDIVEADGEHFIAMEFVDGEDLSSLLRRIGRLPQDKAIEIARQLCAGLAAAHDRSVLHRDLKPANVMLDGRGRVRITDFGIAALAEEMHGKDARSGTPAYMSPEQLAGEAASVRSDIYSLGLVLYEVFTGKEAYHANSAAELQRMQQSGTFTTPSSLVRDLDPLVERVIMRCLERAPHDRPSSAIAVAAALPGGDPLAMALAAGETPSPEMVAQSGASGALTPQWAVIGLAAAIILALLSNIGIDRLSPLRALPMEKAPDVLADRAREIQKRLGYAETPGDWAAWFEANRWVKEFINKHRAEPEVVEQLKSGRLRLVEFAYRSSPTDLAPSNEASHVWNDDPPFDDPGMVRMALDTSGRLLQFEAVPPPYFADPTSTQPAATAPSAEPDWAACFGAADLDIRNFQPAAPTWAPLVPFDQQQSWSGTFPEHPDLPLHIVAASMRGKVVWFNIFGPWSKPPTAEDSGSAGGPLELILNIMFPVLFLGIPGIAALVAWRNVRAGRGDRRGAWRLAMFIIGIGILGWLLGAHHVLGLSEIFMFTRAFGSILASGVVAWLMYLAVEPFARRYWPTSIIAWTRLLSGRWRDPLVGRHVLQGCIAGALAAFVSTLPTLLSMWINGPNYQLTVDPFQGLLGFRHALAAVCNALTGPTFFLGLFVLLLMLRILLRRQWLAVACVSALILLIMAVPGPDSAGVIDPFEVAGSIALSVVLLVCLVRMGLLALLTMIFTSLLLWGFTFTVDFTRWYAGLGLTGLLAFAALAGYGFWIALAGQPLFRDELAAGRT